jgi:hypothetical protein
LPLPPACTFTVVFAVACPSLTVIVTVELPRLKVVVKVAVRVSPEPAKVTLLFGSRLVLEELALRVRLEGLLSASVILRVVLALVSLRQVLSGPPQPRWWGPHSRCD